MVSPLLSNMTANNYLESVKSLPVSVANAKLEELCGVQCFIEHHQGLYDIQSDERDSMDCKDTYGDWQTNFELALNICRLLKNNGINPKVIIEPTCGKGNFILAALLTFDNVEDIYGIEIRKPYIDELKIRILQLFIDTPDRIKVKIHLYNQNIFDFDFASIKKRLAKREVLVLGNPPWVTNSKQGSLGKDNLPEKSNFKRLSGMEALTGKSNFDIAEYICRQMISLMSGEHGYLALLLKNSVIRNILYEQNTNILPIKDIHQYSIDAQKEFNVSVSASLFFCTIKEDASRHCQIKDFYTLKDIHEYGWVNNNFVSDIELYQKYSYMDGRSPLVWWSGIKHDCAKVMELAYNDGRYTNGMGEIVDIEDDMIYPLIKSSDIKGRMISSTRKYVIVTQKTTSDNTAWINIKYPKTYKYLLSHAELLDNRRSRIYKGRSRFCLFGIGEYSFKPYKIAVSGLYKKPAFTLIVPVSGKSVMLDDTCYMLGFDALDDAMTTLRLLNSKPAQSFMKSLIFEDAKRVINKDLLMRIDLMKVLEHSSSDLIDSSVSEHYSAMLRGNIAPAQLSLF